MKLNNAARPLSSPPAVFVAALAALAMFVPVSATKASGPVSFTIIGCVKDGKFTSGKTSSIKIIDRNNSRVSLADFEGKTLRVQGMLSPGDYLQGRFTIVDEACRPELHGEKLN